MSAQTATRRPSVLLTGYRPQSRIGQTFSIWIRAGGEVPFGSGIVSTEYQVGTVRMDRRRSSGVLLHPTSFPDGRLGEQAYRFVDWLAAAGQAWWQVLPLGPPDSFGSPYNAVSAFASSHELVAAPRARVTRAELDAFRERHAYWIDDYARFAGRDALPDQVRFDREWRALREYAAERGVRMIGDVPIFVSHESVDVKAHPELFLT